jgi:hypothetical protein
VSMKRYAIEVEYGYQFWHEEDTGGPYVLYTEALEVEKQRDALQEKVNVAVEALEALYKASREYEYSDDDTLSAIMQAEKQAAEALAKLDKE